MKTLLRIIRDRFISFENFKHGGWTENPVLHQEKLERQRVQYAKDNPWVLRYDLGHRELIERYAERPAI